VHEICRLPQTFADLAVPGPWQYHSSESSRQSDVTLSSCSTVFVGASLEYCCSLFIVHVYEEYARIILGGGSS